MFEALIEAGLVKQKRYENGLSVFKYARKVFYDALWNTDPLLWKPVVLCWMMKVTK